MVSKSGDVMQQTVKPDLDDLANTISFSAYCEQRDANFQLVEELRKNKYLFTSTSKQYPDIITAYEQRLLGINADGNQLFYLLSKAKDLLQMFKAGTDVYKFIQWYNNPKQDEKNIVQANHPRETAHRMIDDLANRSNYYGFVAALENQTFTDMYLDDYIEWYGWPELCKTPSRIKAYETIFFDQIYYGVYNTAAMGLRYRLGDTGWYAYYCIYTYRLGSNCTYVLLSKEKITDWNTLYRDMKNQRSVSIPENCPFQIDSGINWDYRARSYCRLIETQRASLTSSIDYYLNKWITPQNYHDEL